MGRLLFLLLIGIGAVSTASIFIKLCDAPSLIIAAYRMIFASLLLTPFVAFQKRRQGMGTMRLRGCLLSGLFLGLHFAFWIGSLKYTSVASSVVLVATNPIFVGIGGWLFLKERLNLNLILGILFTVLGSGFISLGDTTISREALLGDGLALLGAVSVLWLPTHGKKNPEGPGLAFLYLPCVLHGRFITGFSFSPLSKVFWRIFFFHLPVYVSHRPHSPTHWPHHL